MSAKQQQQPRTKHESTSRKHQAIAAIRHTNTCLHIAKHTHTHTHTHTHNSVRCIAKGVTKG